MHKRRLGAATLFATTLAVTVAVGPAAAAPPPKLHVSAVLSTAFVGPLQFSVSGSQILVADSFTGVLSKVGVPTPIAVNPTGDVGGVGYNRDQHSIAYTTSNEDHSVTALHILRPGHPEVVANLALFESVHNPDSIYSYGVDNPSKCVSDALTSADAPVSYNGEVDSHPYSVVPLERGAWAVADAGGNDVLKVDAAGNVSLLTVLPPVPVVLTAGFAAANDLPACVVGVTYKFEAVPTDVEHGAGGSLLISTLPGGPEGPEGGNPGSVYQLGTSGSLTRIATGFHGATNLAVDSHGSIFVAEISTGTVSQVVAGGPSVVLTVPGVVGLEFANGHLYASTAPAAVGGQGPGTIVKLSY